MTPFVHEFYVNLRTGAAYERAKKPLSQGNALADKIVVHVQDCGNDVDLTGMGVSALVVRFDGQTVPLTGSIEDGAACITLDKDSYAVPGEARVTMMLSAGEMVQTVLVLLVNVDTSQTSIVVDNGTIGDLTELLAAVADMRTATADALAAAETANEAADSNTNKTEEAIADVRANADAVIAEVREQTDAAITELQADADAAIANVHATLGDALEGVAEVLADVAPGIEITESNGLVIVKDAAARPAVQATSSIVAVQSGTGDPTPDNIRPINGWDAVSLTRTGRNLLGFEDFSVAGSGTFTDTCVNGVFRREVRTAHATTYIISTTGMSHIVNPHLPAGTYTFTLTHISGVTYSSPRLEVTLSDGSVVSLPHGDATTLPLDGMITGVRMASKNFEVGDTIEYTMQLEAGAAATDYVAYQGQTLTAALPETVYGGTLDWTTGLLTVTQEGILLDGTEVWGVKNEGTPMRYYYTSVGIYGYVVNDSGACSHYPTRVITSGDVNIGVRVVNMTYEDAAIVLRPDRTVIATVSDLQAYLAEQSAAGTPVTVVYELASPRTIQLTPQQLDMLKGDNAVWSDSGSTALTYIADTKMYIDNAIAAIAASIINA